MIAILGAMDNEIQNLISKLKNEKIIERAGTTFHIGKLNNKDVMIAKTGIGKVNAAIHTQIAIELGATTIINTGIAGSLSPNVKIGDIVISHECLYHDMDATAFGYPLGQVPQMKWMSFPAFTKLVNSAEEVCLKLEIPYHVGRIASGDCFIADHDKKNNINSYFKAICVEMEGAAVAHTCMVNNMVPFVVIRAISDNADDTAGITYEQFEEQAIQNSNRIVEKLLEVIENE